jgi:RNA polymerase sigma-70 factor (ECF subfamily)
MLDFHSSDAGLVHRALGGEAEAFEALVERHGRRAYAIARANGARKSDIDDVLQESFIQAYRDMVDLRNGASFLPWLLSIVRNTVRRFQKLPAAV